MSLTNPPLTLACYSSTDQLGNQIGDLLRDWRRINVSFTRAKKKLVIFGSRKTLQTDCLLAGFLRLMEEKGWIYLLPKGADEMHSRPPSLVGNEEVVKREKKAGRMGKGVLNGKPFAQEVMTVSSSLPVSQCRRST